MQHLAVCIPTQSVVTGTAVVYRLHIIYHLYITTKLIVGAPQKNDHLR